VTAADEAIRVRVSRDGEIPRDERIAFRDAMNALAILKRVRR